MSSVCSVQFSSVEFSSVQFSSAAAAAQIASDMSLFIGNSINCRSSSTGVSTIESTAAVQFSSVRSIMTIVPNRFPASAPTRSNLIRHTHAYVRWLLGIGSSVSASPDVQEDNVDIVFETQPDKCKQYGGCNKAPSNRSLPPALAPGPRPVLCLCARHHRQISRRETMASAE